MPASYLVGGPGELVNAAQVLTVPQRQRLAQAAASDKTVRVRTSAEVMETISKRTKDALAVKKARGAQLGTPANLTEAAREQSLLVRRAHLHQHPGLRQTAAFIVSRRAQGVSFRQLAGELNALGFTAPRGDF